MGHLRARKGTKPITGKPKPAAQGAGTEDIMITLESVTTDYPDIAAALRSEGATAELKRILGIEENSMPGHETIVAEMKADGKTTPEAAAIRILREEKAKGEKRLQSIKDAGKAAGDVPASVSSEANGGAGKTVYASDEEKWKAELAGLPERYREKVIDAEGLKTK